jgi:hypothetical protein
MPAQPRCSAGRNNGALQGHTRSVTSLALRPLTGISSVVMRSPLRADCREAGAFSMYPAPSAGGVRCAPGETEDATGARVAPCLRVRAGIGARPLVGRVWTLLAARSNMPIASSKAVTRPMRRGRHDGRSATTIVPKLFS